MRLAVMTDAHANLPALETALAAIDELGCEAIVHTGDTVAIGPFPARTLSLLIERSVTCVPGNHDLWFAHGLPDPHPAWMSEGEVEHQHWTHARLDPALRAVVAAWPRTLLQDYAGLRVLFTHYAWQVDGSDFAPFVRSPRAADFDALYGDIPADLVFHGHDHVAHDLAGRRRYVNPGSLGCFSAPVARFVVLDVAANGTYTLEAHAVPYDDAPLSDAFERGRVPERDALVERFFGGRFELMARRSSWDTEPLPETRVALPYDRTFTANEYRRLRRGHIPQEQEDKWFAFLEDDWLYWHRSWTGYGIYALRLEPVEDGWRVAEAWASRLTEQYLGLGSVEAEASLLDQLITGWLLVDRR